MPIYTQLFEYIGVGYKFKCDRIGIKINYTFSLLAKINMRRIITFVIVLTTLTFSFFSCLNYQPFIEGKISDNQYINKYLSLKIPTGWNVRKSGGYQILIVQKQVNTGDGIEFPTIILEAGTMKDNSYPAYFTNSIELARGCIERFNKNELYATNNSIDSIKVNGLTLYSFESRLLNGKFKKPDMIQRQYYFNVDTIYFHLNVSNYDRIKEVVPDYKTLIESITPK